MSPHNSTGTTPLEFAEIPTRQGSSRLSWSVKLFVFIAVLSAAAFCASVVSYRGEAERKFVQAHEALAAVLDMNRPGKRTLASLDQRRGAASWLAPWESLPDVDLAFITNKGKVIAGGSSAELPKDLISVATAPVPNERRVAWLPNPSHKEWLVLSLPLGGDLVVHLARSRAGLDAEVRAFELREAMWAAACPVLSAMILFLLLGPSMLRLAALSSRLQKLGQGRFDVKLPQVGTGDIGRLERVFNAAVWNLKGRLEKDADDKFRRQREIRDLEEAIKSLRSGDLNIQVVAPSVALKAVCEVFNLTVQELREFLYSLRENSNVINERTHSLIATGREVTVRENEQKIQLERLGKDLDAVASHVDQVVSSIEQEQEALAFLASITETGEGSVTQVVTEIYSKVDDGSKQVSHKIHDLEQQSQEIGKMTELITELAGQTNLLSLNAALEASRVGEQGRGFAAVADEIRKLAVKVTESAGEIQSMVETVANDSRDALGLLDRSGAEMAGSKVMVEAALASLTDLVESARTARQSSSSAHETLVEMAKETGVVRNSVGQINERANSTVTGMNSLGDAMSTVARIAEENVKRLNRLQINAPPDDSRQADAGAPPKGVSSGPAREQGTPNARPHAEKSPAVR